MSNDTPASEPPTDEDLDRIERMIASHPEDAVVRVGDIRPLVLRLVAEVRRLLAESRGEDRKFDSQPGSQVVERARRFVRAEA